MIVPFEKLSPKRFDFTTTQGLDASFEAVDLGIGFELTFCRNLYRIKKTVPSG